MGTPAGLGEEVKCVGVAPGFGLEEGVAMVVLGSLLPRKLGCKTKRKKKKSKPKRLLVSKDHPERSFFSESTYILGLFVVVRMAKRTAAKLFRFYVSLRHLLKP